MRVLVEEGRLRAFRTAVLSQQRMAESLSGLLMSQTAARMSASASASKLEVSGLLVWLIVTVVLPSMITAAEPLPTLWLAAPSVKMV